MDIKFSPKQLNVLAKTATGNLGFINILEGSVRSGKTYVANAAWALFILESPHTKFLMSGESTDSLYRNVIDDLIKIFGRSRATYQESAKGGARLVINYGGKKKICYCRGGSKANDEAKIRGLTLGGWYADEITLHHESFVKMALSRLSLNGAKTIWTTNPDSPFHPIKKEYVDLAAAKNYGHWHFDLEDNLSLSQEYKDNIKAAYAGIFYDRFIRGLWVLADGIIYSMFDEKIHVVPTKDRPYFQKYVSVDFGMQNPTTYGLFGKCTTDGKWYKIKEYHHSGREEKQQKTVSEYIDDLIKFMDGEPLQVIVDPSAAAFIEEAKRKNIKIKKANNDVLTGIANVSKALKNEEIYFNDCCKETLKEFATYIWDANASLKGKDAPVKENDHHMDDLRYFINTVAHRSGGVSILK